MYKQDGVLDKNRTKDNVQKNNIFVSFLLLIQLRSRYFLETEFCVSINFLLLLWKGCIFFALFGIGPQGVHMKYMNIYNKILI
jgi:hypothetical protein